jgi:hypothetical protein
MQIIPATTALRNNFETIDVDKPSAALFRHEPTAKRAIALRVVGLSKRYGTRGSSSQWALSTRC